VSPTSRHTTIPVATSAMTAPTTQTFLNAGAESSSSRGGQR
jgi:hypothetical protein